MWLSCLVPYGGPVSVYLMVIAARGGGCWIPIWCVTGSSGLTGPGRPMMWFPCATSHMAMADAHQDDSVGMSGLSPPPSVKALLWSHTQMITLHKFADGQSTLPVPMTSQWPPLFNGYIKSWSYLLFNVGPIIQGDYQWYSVYNLVLKLLENGFQKDSSGFPIGEPLMVPSRTPFGSM